MPRYSENKPKLDTHPAHMRFDRIPSLVLTLSEQFFKTLTMRAGCGKLVYTSGTKPNKRPFDYIPQGQGECYSAARQ